MRKTSSVRKIPRDQGLLMWEHTPYKGQCDYRVGDVKDMGKGNGTLNDKVSSLKVLSGARELYQHPEWRGRFVGFTKNTPELPSLIFDQVSSIRKVTGGYNPSCEII